MAIIREINKKLDIQKIAKFSPYFFETSSSKSNL